MIVEFPFPKRKPYRCVRHASAYFAYKLHTHPPHAAKSTFSPPRSRQVEGVNTALSTYLPRFERASMTDKDLSAGGVSAPFDPFADAVGDDLVVTKGIVHIRLQQRNGRKSLTTVQGLDEKLDLGKLTKAFKKEFCCNGCVVENKELGRIIQLQGDQREKVKSFLADEEIAAKKMIKVHGI